MGHFYESLLIDTKEGMQCKTYANSHPDGYIIVKPKYVPSELLNSKDLKKRFLFSRCMTRFNLFSKKGTVQETLELFKKSFPRYLLEDKNHKNWFFVVPEDEISKSHDPKAGLKELLKVPYEDLDSYLKATVDIIKLLTKSGISIDDIGITHSTLLGNYTPGKSDIDLLVFGKENGWKAIHFLETAKDARLRWKTKEEWAKYYKDRVVSKVYTEAEYVFNMTRKRDDGFYDNNVFSIFCLEEPSETWYDWTDRHTPLGTVKITARVTDDYNSIVRPGYYDIDDVKLLDGQAKTDIKRIVTWSRPFVLQARKGEMIEACGLLEQVHTKKGENYYQLVIGYMDAYTTDREEKEYLKVKVD